MKDDKHTVLALKPRDRKATNNQAETRQMSSEETADICFYQSHSADT